jgi:hypothetical protein
MGISVPAAVGTGREKKPHDTGVALVGGHRQRGAARRAQRRHGAFGVGPELENCPYHLLMVEARGQTKRLRREGGGGAASEVGMWGRVKE